MSDSIFGMLPGPRLFILSGTVLTFPLLQMNRDGRLAFTVLPITNAITSIKLQAQTHPESPLFDYLADAALSFGTTPSIVTASSTAPYQTTAGSTGWAILSLGLIYSVRFVVTLAGAGSATLSLVH